MFFSVSNDIYYKNIYGIKLTDFVDLIILLTTKKNRLVIHFQSMFSLNGRRTHKENSRTKVSSSIQEPVLCRLFCFFISFIIESLECGRIERVKALHRIWKVKNKSVSEFLWPMPDNEQHIGSCVLISRFLISKFPRFFHIE